MKHILFIVDYFPPHQWWVENVFDNLTSRLATKWHKITILTSHFSQSLQKIDKKSWNTTIFRVWNGRKSFFFLSILKWIQLLKANPDIQIIHSSTYTSWIPASILATLFHKKSVLTVHEVFWKLRNHFKPRYSRRIYQLFEWLTFKFPHDIYHCVSLYTLNSIRLLYAVPDSKLYLIYNWVDTTFWHPQATSDTQKQKIRQKYWLTNKVILLYYGHSGISKWIDHLIAALSDTQSTFPDIHCIFNLIPANRDTFIRQKLQKFQNISIFSWFPQDELRDLVASADCVIAPSLSEWFWSVHTEVSAMNIPLITSKIAAIPEVVSWNIIFIQPSSPRSILEGIKKWRNKQYSLISPKTFSRDITTAEILSLYQNLVSKP